MPGPGASCWFPIPPPASLFLCCCHPPSLPSRPHHLGTLLLVAPLSPHFHLACPVFVLLSLPLYPPFLPSVIIAIILLVCVWGGGALLPLFSVFFFVSVSLLASAPFLCFCSSHCFSILISPCISLSLCLPPLSCLFPPASSVLHLSVLPLTRLSGPVFLLPFHCLSTFVCYFSHISSLCVCFCPSLSQPLPAPSPEPLPPHPPCPGVPLLGSLPDYNTIPAGRVLVNYRGCFSGQRGEGGDGTRESWNGN